MNQSCAVKEMVGCAIPALFVVDDVCWIANETGDSRKRKENLVVKTVNWLSRLFFTFHRRSQRARFQEEDLG